MLEMVDFVFERAAQQFARAPEFAFFTQHTRFTGQAGQHSFKIGAHDGQSRRHIFRQVSARASGQAQAVEIPSFRIGDVAQNAAQAPALARLFFIQLLRSQVRCQRQQISPAPAQQGQAMLNLRG